MSTTAVIREIREADFDAEVLAASRSRPVVVDFWAPWCGPCHQLSPLLERVAARYAGEVTTAKLNVDEAPGVAQRYRVQGIPAVKGFRDGAVVAELTGVQPEPVLERLFAALAPGPADKLVAEAAAAPDDRREDLLRAALDADPGHAGALVALARLLADRGEHDDARALLDRAPGDAQARRLLAELELAAESGDPEDLRSAAEAGDPEARLRLGRLLAARGQHAEALAVLLEAVRHPATRQEARQAVLAVFEMLGNDHDLVRGYRPKLASALF